MSQKQSGFWGAITVLFAAAIYSAAVFLLKPSMDTSSWILYGATMLAFALLAVQGVTDGGSGMEVVLNVLTRPVAIVYFVGQLVVGGIICMSMNGLPPTPVAVVELIWLALYLVIQLVTGGWQSRADAQDAAAREAVRTLRVMENDVLSLADAQQDPAVKAALNSLAEEIHFSDAVSLPALESTDTALMAGIGRLGDQLRAGETAQALEAISRLQREVKDRNRAAAMLRRS